MEAIKIQIKKTHKDGVIPSYGREGDCGLDLTAVSFELDEFGNASYSFGISIKIPEGYAGFIFPRSSICKKNQHLTNAVGIVDSNFTGTITAKFKPTEVYLDHYVGNTPILAKKDNLLETLGGSMYGIGERIAQLVILPYPKIEFEEVEELPQTNRNDASYGSSGR